MTDRDSPALPMPQASLRLLYLHGLFGKTFSHSGRDLAKLLAKGLDRAVVSTAPDLLLADGGRCPRYLVQPQPGGTAWRTIEVVEVVYDDIITERYERQSLIRRASLGTWKLLAHGWRLVRLFGGRGPRITARQRGMAAIMALVLLLAVALMVLLVVTIVYGAMGSLDLVLQWLHSRGVPEMDAFRQWLQSLGILKQAEATAANPTTGLIASIAFLAVIAKLFVSKNFAEQCSDAANAVFAATDYQNPHAALRRALLERVESAMQAGSGLGVDGPVSILAYSQGTLMAIDALFPKGETNRAPWPRIDLLVTLGCPIAVSARLWPNQFSRSAAGRAEVCRWINYFERDDRLGGEIAQQMGDEGVEVEVEDREFSYRKVLGRKSIKPHQRYWDDEEPGQHSTPTLIAPELVGDRERTPRGLP